MSVTLYVLSQKGDVQLEPASKGYLRGKYAGIFRILGYIGDENVCRVVQQFLDTLGGQLDQMDEINIRAALDCLGIMAQRRVPGAVDALRKMTLPGYWLGKKFRVYPETVSKKIEVAELASMAIGSYALGDHPDFAEVLQSARNDLDDDLKTRYADRFQEKNAKEYAHDIQNSSRQPFPPSSIVALDDLWPRVQNFLRSLDVDRWAQSVPVSPELLRKTRDDALAGYEEVKRGMLEKSSWVASRVLVNGRRPNEHPLRMKELIAAQRAILAEVELERYGLSDVRIRREVVYNLPSDAKSTGDVMESEQILVFEAKLKGSEELARKFFPNLDSRRTLTLSDNGCLMICMFRIKGTWYWNPYGW